MKSCKKLKVNSLCRFNGHVGHESLHISRSNQAYFESSFEHWSVKAGKSATAVNWRKLCADKRTVRFCVIIVEFSLVESLQSACQFTHELQRDRNIRQRIFCFLKRNHVAFVILSIVTSVL
jgi:hypothetical protein